MNSRLINLVVAMSMVRQSQLLMVEEPLKVYAPTVSTLIEDELNEVPFYPQNRAERRANTFKKAKRK
jgi:hypothetical protein